MICDISQAVQHIAAKANSLLLIDTCSLLDIVRVPLRSNINHSHIQGAIDIVKKVKSGHISLAVTDTIVTEFRAHLAPVCTELEGHIRTLESKNLSIINAMESVGLSYQFNINGLADQKLPEKLRELAENLLSSAFTLQRDKECGNRAHDRVDLLRAPASKGKSESKDCLIIEHFLELVKQLRETGYNEKVVFVTNNSKDYGQPGALLPPLGLEFKKVQIEYCNNFAWALSVAEGKP
jgi:hypothetical protein